MKKSRVIGYAVWLVCAACLYFFENNTGTRVILICSVLFPLIPPLRKALFSADEATGEAAAAFRTSFPLKRGEAEETGGVRGYRPGDPLRRIHWKLSAKKGEVLVRETAEVPATAEGGQADAFEAGKRRTAATAEEAETAEQGRRADREAGKRKKWVTAALAGGMLCCGLLLALIPRARQGLLVLCNRIFAESEAVNAYAYTYFPTDGEADLFGAACLAGGIVGMGIALAAVHRSRGAGLGMMAGCTLFQVYFGLAFPGWVNAALYGGLAVWMMRRPLGRKSLVCFCGAFAAVLLLTVVAAPGVDAATEAASEAVRDRLSQMTGGTAGGAAEAPEGETETRHVHNRALETGEREAQTERTFRLVTEEEEQISQPRWRNWLKMIGMTLLAIGAVVLPFAPFVLMNARKRKAEEARKAFYDENIGEAVQRIFGEVIRWLEETGRGGGNRLFREWEEGLRADLPEGYAGRFARCAADYEEAVYSSHALPEEKRQNALALLRETEEALWEKADWKQRIRLRFRMGAGE